jgi:hypothetical protein
LIWIKSGNPNQFFPLRHFRIESPVRWRHRYGLRPTRPPDVALAPGFFGMAE